MLQSCRLLRLTGADLIRGEGTGPSGIQLWVRVTGLCPHNAFYKHEQKAFRKEKDKSVKIKREIGYYSKS